MTKFLPKPDVIITHESDLDGLVAQAPALDEIPPRAAVRLLWKAIAAAAIAESAVPTVPAMRRRLRSA